MMSVVITKKYLCGTLYAIKDIFSKGNTHKKREKYFSTLETSKMVGEFARFTEGAPFLRHLVSQFYASIVVVLAQNRITLKDPSPEFRKLVETIT